MYQIVASLSLKYLKWEKYSKKYLPLKLRDSQLDIILNNKCISNRSETKQYIHVLQRFNDIKKKKAKTHKKKYFTLS